MKNKLIKISLLFIFAFLVLTINNKVNANSIKNISMNIVIDDNGNAQITEKWECTTTEGTECYHPYYNLGNSEIANLIVSDEDKSYTTLTKWDTTGDIEDKAYKCGISKINNGIEICWGISEYAKNKIYTIKYNITNFVSELDDSQMVYWTLIPYEFSNKIGSVQIKISSNKYFEDTIDVWGYGNYGGLCYVNNGAIYMQSDGELDKSEYMTILAKFPKQTFNTTNTINKDFNYYYEMAEEGTKKYKSNIFTILWFIAKTYIPAFIPIFILAGIGKLSSTKKYGFKYGSFGKKIPKDINYYRDIPCEGNIFKAYYIAYQYGLVKNKTDILGAIILKWLKLGFIRTESKVKGGIFNKEDTVIILNDEIQRNFDIKKEEELFNMMVEASEDGILENKEFEKWCKKSYDEILGWFDKILKDERDNLVNEGYIKTENGIFGKKYNATEEIKNEAINIAGLRKYLLEYTLISKREAIEVKLFEEYLIYAQMLGIAKQVSKQFKELYPNLIEQTNYNSYDNLVYINYCASRGISRANSARSAAQSYSSGGGGFSSGGGGGGSFGGGGGRRWLPLKINLNHQS